MTIIKRMPGAKSAFIQGQGSGAVCFNAEVNQQLGSEQAPSTAVVLSLSNYTEHAAAGTLAALSAIRSVSDCILLVENTGDDLSALLEQWKSPARISLISNRNSRLLDIDTGLQERGLALGPPDTSRALWYALGYILSSSDAEVIAVIDADDTAQPELFEPLLYPLASSQCNFQLSRSLPVNDSEGGIEAACLRHLVEAIDEVFGRGDYVQNLIPFLYPAGSALAFRRELALSLRLPRMSDLQLTLLTGLQREMVSGELCQVPSPVGQSRGVDESAFVAVLLDNLRSEGAVLSVSALQTLKLSFQEKALDYLLARRRDCALHGQEFNGYEAEACIGDLAAMLFTVGSRVADGSYYLAVLPPWKRAIHAWPDLPTQLIHAVDQGGSQPRAPTPKRESRRRSPHAPEPGIYPA